MTIAGFAISGYRSFGPELQRIGPLEKVNLFAGPNNSGKSNILRFVEGYLKEALSQSARGNSLSLRLEDRHIGVQAQVKFGVATKSLVDDHCGSTKPNWMGAFVQKIEDHLKSAAATTVAWFDYPQLTVDGPDVAAFKQLRDVLDRNDWQRLCEALSGGGGGSFEQHWVPETIARLSPVHKTVPDVITVPAIREIVQASDDDADTGFSGRGLIARLAELQNPDSFAQANREQFKSVESFARRVLDDPNVALEVPHHRETITVHMNGRSLPLESLGTGIHEVIILAAAATVAQNQIVCLEEPEIHLHPTLQRLLIDHLQNDTTNQYFIATHSAHILDSPDCAVFRVWLENACTKVAVVSGAQDRVQICHDLGYRASDLLQANAIIWVEGPSDRLYIRWWLNAIDPDLIEGVHYSVMFYGGRLLSHLSADHGQIDDFIDLRRINQNMVIVMDSDKDNARSRLNATKRRIRDAFDGGPGFAWVTKGREIENYIDPAQLQAAAAEVHPKLQPTLNVGQFDRTLKHDDSTLDKVAIARRVVEPPQVPDMNVLDLEKRVEELAQFVHDANS